MQARTRSKPVRRLVKEPNRKLYNLWFILALAALAGGITLGKPFYDQLNKPVLQVVTPHKQVIEVQPSADELNSAYRAGFEAGKRYAFQR